MLNLLTGKRSSCAEDTDKALLNEPWTAEAHLAVMRRLLNEASRNLATAPASALIAAARVHVEAAKVAGRTPLPVKTAPARAMPRDGDSL